jgi:hypothetical protein
MVTKKNARGGPTVVITGMAAARVLCAIGLVTCIVAAIVAIASDQGSGSDIAINLSIGAALAVILIAVRARKV